MQNILIKQLKCHFYAFVPLLISTDAVISPNVTLLTGNKTQLSLTTDLDPKLRPSSVLTYDQPLP